MLGKKKEMMKRRVEEIRHDTVKEHKKICKYTNSLTEEYQQRNLNALDVSEDWLSEKKKVKVRRNILKEN